MSDKKYKNPVRRNRNIGTAKQGRGKNNRFVIPSRWEDGGIYWENLSNPVAVTVDNQGHRFTVLVEPTRKGYVHACTVDDVVKLFLLFPESHRKAIHVIILRQPKRKEEILKPLWGRISYNTSIGRYSGPAIHLDAQMHGMTMKWPRSLSPGESKELERLEKDGHIISSDRRSYYIESNPDAVRNTQLYRTLPHEMGHYVDYLENFIKPSKQDDDEADVELIKQKYESRPAADKEEFAHGYAERFFRQKQDDGELPFPRIVNFENMQAQNLKPEWFLINDEKHI